MIKPYNPAWTDEEFARELFNSYVSEVSNSKHLDLNDAPRDVKTMWTGVVKVLRKMITLRFLNSVIPDAIDLREIRAEVDRCKRIAQETEIEIENRVECIENEALVRGAAHVQLAVMWSSSIVAAVQGMRVQHEAELERLRKRLRELGEVDLAQVKQNLLEIN